MGPIKTFNAKYTIQVASLIFSGKLFMYSMLFQSNPTGRNDSSLSRKGNSSIFSSERIVKENMPAMPNNISAEKSIFIMGCFSWPISAALREYLPKSFLLCRNIRNHSAGIKNNAPSIQNIKRDGNCGNAIPAVRYWAVNSPVVPKTIAAVFLNPICAVFSIIISMPFSQLGNFGQTLFRINIKQAALNRWVSGRQNGAEERSGRPSDVDEAEYVVKERIPVL